MVRMGRSSVSSMLNVVWRNGRVEPMTLRWRRTEDGRQKEKPTLVRTYPSRRLMAIPIQQVDPQLRYYDSTACEVRCRAYKRFVSRRRQLSGDDLGWARSPDEHATTQFRVAAARPADPRYIIRHRMGSPRSAPSLLVRANGYGIVEELCLRTRC